MASTIRNLKISKINVYFRVYEDGNALIRCTTYIDCTSELFSLQDIQLGEVKFLEVVTHR